MDTTNWFPLWRPCVVLALTLQVGCSSSNSKQETVSEEEIRAERDKLSASDHALVDAQEWCVIQTEARLGSAGPPVKVRVRRQTIFLCCENCRVQAEGDPDETLATLAKLKARKQASVEKQK